MQLSKDLPSPLESILEAADKIAPFPKIVWKVLPLIRSMAPISEIEAIIMYDQAITARVLALSRSPIYSRRRSIGCLRDAIVALGDQQLSMVILTACSARYLTKEVPGYDLKEGALWEHSVSVALMTDIICRRLGRRKMLTAYTAALLHDIGKTVLSSFVDSYFDPIYSLCRERGMSFLDAEVQVLGIDHQHLGAIIARRWNFPDEVIESIGCHHHPMRAKEHQDLAMLVYMANRMVSALGIGPGADGFLQPSEDQVFVRLGITAHMAEKFLAELVEALEDTKQFLAVP